MSRLSEILNPASPAPSPQPPTAQPINTTIAESYHRRNPSITSPLEALALAATEKPSTTLLHQTANNSLPPGDAKASAFKNASTDSPTTAYQSVTTQDIKKETGASPVAGAAMNASVESPAATGQSASKSFTDTQHVKQEDALDGTGKPPALTSLTEVKKEPTDSNPPTPAVQSPTVLSSTEGKKRPAPKVNKKGTASVIKKPAAKKRKVEPAQSKDGTPFSQRSETPNSTRGSKTPAPKNRKRGSATPVQSSPPRSVDGDEDEDGGDDGELFCICRKPDDHKWMIGCDGGCDDWFHGKCVDMREEDAELIDKYICPNCTAKGVGVTTWKPMCRLEGCREPARVAGPRPSKYCSDEHGEEFMQRKIFGKDSTGMRGAFKRKKASEDQGAINAQADRSTVQVSNQAHLRGGYLTPSELKSLIASSNSVHEFKRLGESVLLSDSAHPVDKKDAMEMDDSSELLCTPEERSRLEEVKSKKSGLSHRLSALKDKEKLLGMVRSRAQSVLGELNKKPSEGKKKDTIKDICGFDSRLSWSDAEFDDWRNSSEGSKVLESGVLGPPPVKEPAAEGEVEASMLNSAAVDAGEFGRGVCQKKRCDRHKTWFKLHQQEISSERGECLHQLQRLDHEAKGIGERAMVKRLESEAEAGIAGS